MARQVLGLVGPGRGPKVAVGAIRGLRARVSGMTDGKVSVENGHCGFTFDKDGDYELTSECWEFVQVEYSGTAKEMICVLTGEAA